MTTATPEAPTLPFRRVAARPLPVETVESDRVIGPMTLDAYVTFNRAAITKHEFIEGVVVCMPGTSFEHSLISSNLMFHIRGVLESSGSDAYIIGSDLSVYISEKTFFYPDVMIAPATPQIDGHDALHNPIAVIEILSFSTAGFDLGRKFELYRAIPSLEHYLLVDQYRVSVTHHAKDAQGVWSVVGECTTLSESVTLNILGNEIAVPLSAIYHRVSF